MRKIFLMVIGGLLFSASCAPSPVELTATANLARQQTQTAIPTQTSTPTPTLTPSPSPTRTPTVTPTPIGGGGTMAFVSVTNVKGQIALYNIATGITTFPTLQLNPGLDSVFGVDSVALAPDGTKLAFTQAVCPAHGAGPSMTFCRRDLFVSNVDGSDVVQLTKTELDEDWPVWSPDGTKIAYVFATSGVADIYSVNVDGSGKKRLTDAPGWDWLPTWSPDGRRLAFQSQRNGNFQVYVMNADGSGHAIQLTKIKGSTCGNPAWSPDGSKIAFVAYFTKTSDIYLMNTDGSDPTNLTAGKFGAVGGPTWSPDGKKIAFTCDEHVCLMNPDGTGITTFKGLTNISNRSISWSQP